MSQLVKCRHIFIQNIILFPHVFSSFKSLCIPDKMAELITLNSWFLPKEEPEHYKNLFDSATLY